MNGKINKKSVLLFLLVFLAILFKYLSMWSYLIVGEFKTSLPLFLVIIALFLILISNLKVLKKNFKKMLLLGIGGVIITVMTSSIDYAIACLFAIVFSISKDGDKKFVKYFFISSIILFILTILMSVMGILPENNSIRRVDGETLVRANLGFTGMNTVFLCFLPIVLSFFILYEKKFEKKKLLVIIITFLISYVLYKATLCRTGFYCSLIMLLLFFFVDNIHNSKIISVLVKYSYIILLIISIGIAIIYGSTYENSVNMILTGRPYYWNYYISNYQLSLTGIDILNTMPLDNAYLTYLYDYGIICFILFAYITFISQKSISKNKYILLAFLVFAIYGIFENNFIYHYNFMLTLQMIYIIGIKDSCTLIKEESSEEEKTKEFYKLEDEKQILS